MAKATRKQALGRGLSALLKEPSEKISASEKNTNTIVGSIVGIELN